MSGLGPVIEHLILCLRVLPGVGPKSAQRIALDLLERKPERAARLAEALTAALERVCRCRKCQNLGETELCTICSDPRRDAAQLCIVESPLDVLAIEQSAAFRGCYFVLQGRLSPLDGIGPDAIGLPLLEHRLQDGQLRELILATSSTVEGEATAEYIARMAQPRGLPVSRLARGIPAGGELGLIDRHTLGHAFMGRKPF